VKIHLLLQVLLSVDILQQELDRESKVIHELITCIKTTYSEEENCNTQTLTVTVTVTQRPARLTKTCDD